MFSTSIEGGGDDGELSIGSLCGCCFGEVGISFPGVGVV